MDQKIRFIADYQRHFFSLAELCSRFGVSRKTAYKWIERYEADGPSGLEDRSRRPACLPSPDSDDGGGGAARLPAPAPQLGSQEALTHSLRRQPDWNWPSRSTCSDLLLRHGLVNTKKRRTYPGHPGRPMTPMDAAQFDLDR